MHGHVITSVDCIYVNGINTIVNSIVSVNNQMAQSVSGRCQLLQRTAERLWTCPECCDYNPVFDL